LLPDQSPLAVQLVAFVETQVRTAELPLSTEEGLAPRESVGRMLAEETVTVTDSLVLPPFPVHWIVYVAFPCGETD